MNLPDKFNAMAISMVDEMFRAFYDANHDPSIGVIVVAGAGKHFGVGGDVMWERWGLREAGYAPEFTDALSWELATVATLASRQAGKKGG